MSLLFCVVTLGAGTVGLWPSADKASSPGTAATPQHLTGTFEAESVWAQALLESVRREDSNEARAEVRKLFVQALDRAENLAPVYLSIAERSPGPWEAFDSIDALQRELDRRAGDLSPRLAEVAARKAPTGPLTLKLMEALSEPLERFRRGDDSDIRLKRIVRAFADPNDCAWLCLEAAVAEDASCWAAWFELIRRAEDPALALALLEAGKEVGSPGTLSFSTDVFQRVVPPRIRCK